MAGHGQVDPDSWHDLIGFIEHLPAHIGGVCTYRKDATKFGDLKAYDEYMKPRQFVNLTIIRKELNSHKKYKSNLDVLRVFNDMLSNAIRFWYDPTPVESNPIPGKKTKPAPYEPRKNVVVLITKVQEHIASNESLVAALKAEGVQFAPWYNSFPGASLVAQQLEKWYLQNYTEGYYFYYRDGCYHGSDEEDPWSDPADYGEYVSNPVYLSDIFEKLYTGSYTAAAQVHTDMLTMFANASVYYGDDAEFGAGKFRAKLESDFESMWGSAIAPRLNDAAGKPKDFLPKPSEPPMQTAGGLSSAVAAGSGGAGAGAGAGVSSPLASHHAVQQQAAAQQLMPNQIVGLWQQGMQSGGAQGAQAVFAQAPVQAMISPATFQQWYVQLHFSLAQAMQAVEALKASQAGSSQAAGAAEGAVSTTEGAAAGQAEAGTAQATAAAQ